MIEPTKILDRMHILDLAERHRMLELMEIILLALAMKHAGATESVTALIIVTEILDLELEGHSTPTQVM